MLELQRVDESKAGPPPKPQNFTGRVRMQNLAQAGGATKVEMLAVHFDAGAHTRPHTHPSEQILHFVRGSGFVWLAGEERQLLPEGSIVVVPGRGRAHARRDRGRADLPHRAPRGGRRDGLGPGRRPGGLAAVPV